MQKQAISLAAAIILLGTLSTTRAEELGETFVTDDGITIWYEVTGSGEGTPLILVNGGPGFDHAYLHGRAWDRIGSGRPVVFYDQRGNGRSQKITTGVACGLAEQISDLDALRAHLGYERIDLLGHSWGGFVVMSYSARHPERVSHLVTVGSTPPKLKGFDYLFSDVYPDTVEEQAKFAFGMELGDPDAIAGWLNDYFSMIFYDRQNLEAFRDRARRENFQFSQAVNTAVWNDAERFDLTPELAKFKMPTLVVTGRYDFNVAPSVAWSIHRAVQASEFAAFEKSGHMPFFEEEDAFVERLQNFLTTPSSARE